MRVYSLGSLTKSVEFSKNRINRFFDAMKRTLYFALMTGMTLFVPGCTNSDDATGENNESATAVSELERGKQIYEYHCAVCHNAGVAEAPKLGDWEAWQPRMSNTREQMLHTTMTGIPPGMPVKGLCMTCSEEELMAAIDFMLAALPTEKTPTPPSQSPNQLPSSTP